MIERPDIDDADLARWVGRAWELDVTEVRFMPFGLDGWAYDISASSGRFFLKVKREFPGLPAVLVPQFLLRARVAAVVAPIETTDAQPSFLTAGYCLLLYPYVDDRNLWESGLTDEQWRQYGQVLAAIHGVTWPKTITVPTETFTTTAPDRIQSLADAAARSPHLADLWAAHGAEILRQADGVRSLATQAAAVGAKNVLCHADVHPGNLLADANGSLHVVDWDAPLLAPRERDLMFVFGGEFGEHPINPDREQLFRRGYGPLELDPILMAYYRAERKLDDIALFMANVLDDAITDVTRENELFWLRRIIT